VTLDPPVAAAASRWRVSGAHTSMNEGLQVPDDASMPEIVLEKDVRVPTRDGGWVAVDILRPPGDEPVPAIVTMGAYSKDLYWADKYPMFPSIEMNPYMNWETPDPTYWVPRGYALVRADSPGTGKSPGVADVFGPVEHHAYYDVIEWAAAQPWCTGKIGGLGISYFAILQWMVAALRPPHLAAIVPWEGFTDSYREWTYQGGIFCNEHNDDWWNRQFLPYQYGAGELAEEELAANRVDLLTVPREHPLDDDWHRAHSADLSKIEVPLLSAANWHSLHLHLRGNVEGFVGAGSAHKWMVMYSGNHVEPFYSQWGREVQAQFLDYWLKGEDTGMLDVPRVRIGVRRGHELVWRDEADWPIPSTRWTPLYLDAGAGSLVWDVPADESSTSYPAPQGSAAFETAPVDEELEIIGPVSLKVWVAATCEDMDLFVTLRHFDRDGNEITVEGPHGHGQRFPMAMGWLRASHRELDPERSQPGRPWHPHTRRQPLEPGEPVALEVEIWPTSMTLSPGERLRLVISANDDYIPQAGWAPGLRHNDPDDRPASRFAGQNTILAGGAYDSHLLLPVIPAGA
jgi:uncharacterized protein